MHIERPDVNGDSMAVVLCTGMQHIC